MFLQYKPWDSQHNTPCGTVGDDNAETEIVVGYRGVDIKSEQDANHNRQDDNFTSRLGDECHVENLVAHHHVVEIISIAIDFTSFILMRLVSHKRRVSGEAGEGSRPESDAHLISNQADHVQTNRYLPLVWSIDTHPAKTEAESYHGPEEEDPRTPLAIIGHATKNEEEDDLDGEADAIAEKDD